MDGGETLAVESTSRKGCGEAIEVAVDDGLVDVAADAGGVPGRHDRRRKGENDGHGRDAGG